MANGKKNYFRHSFFAGSDDKIVNLISEHGKQAYFHYFRLLELCGQQCAETIPEKFIFHRRTLCAELLVTNSKLGHHLSGMQSSLLLHYFMDARKVEVLVPNLSKYLGKYENKNSSNVANKTKEKEIKEKETKENVSSLSSFDYFEKFRYLSEIGVTHNQIAHIVQKSGLTQEQIIDSLDAFPKQQNYSAMTNPSAILVSVLARGEKFNSPKMPNAEPVIDDAVQAVTNYFSSGQWRPSSSGSVRNIGLPNFCVEPILDLIESHGGGSIITSSDFKFNAFSKAVKATITQAIKTKRGENV